MSGTYTKSIFAYELESILKGHSLQLAHLKRVPLVFESKKVDRLIASLTRVKPLAALNQVEIIELVKQLHLSHDEYLRIYAALIALGVQRLMLEYLSDERAWKIADEVREAVLDVQRQNPELSQDFFTRRLRRLSAMQEASSAPSVDLPGAVNDPLDDVLDSYDEGIVLAALGQLSADVEDGRMLLGQAQLCLQKAVGLLESMPGSLREGEAWKYWYAEVQKQFAVVEDELG